MALYKKSLFTYKLDKGFLKTCKEEDFNEFFTWENKFDNGRSMNTHTLKMDSEILDRNA